MKILSKIYVLVIAIILSLSLCSCKSIVLIGENDYRQTKDFRNLNNHTTNESIEVKLSDDEYCILRIITSYDEFADNFKLDNFTYNEDIYGDVYRNKEKYFNKYGLLIVTYINVRSVGVNIHNINFKYKTMYINLLMSEDNSMAAVSTVRRVLYEVPINKLKKVNKVKIEKKMCDELTPWY